MKEPDNPATKRMDITMNVRTYIATAALSGMVANIGEQNPVPLARYAVACADALIAELTKPVGDKS